MRVESSNSRGVRVSAARYVMPPNSATHTDARRRAAIWTRRRAHPLVADVRRQQGPAPVIDA